MPPGSFLNFSRQRRPQKWYVAPLYSNDPALLAGSTFIPHTGSTTWLLIGGLILSERVSAAFMSKALGHRWPPPAILALTGYRPPKIIAIDSPDPNTTNESIVIQVSMLFDTAFTSSSIGVLLSCWTPPDCSLGG